MKKVYEYMGVMMEKNIFDLDNFSPFNFACSQSIQLQIVKNLFRPVGSCVDEISQSVHDTSRALMTSNISYR